MFLRQISDSALAQNAYLIGCQRSGEAIVVDPERDIDRYLRIAADEGFKLVAAAETHIHADFLGGTRELLERHGLRAYLSAEGGPDWQYEWAAGHASVTLLHAGSVFRIGNISFQALHTPGHTPEHLSFLVTDLGGGADQPLALLSGDFIFVGDVGRPDLLESAAGQAGSMRPAARVLYESLRQTRELAEFLQILPAHGAGSACGKSLGAVPTGVLGYERRFNPALREALEGGQEEFVNHILSGQPEPPPYFARMKRENRRGPALLPDGGLPRPEKIGTGDLPAWIGAEGRTILDLRGDRKAFMARHLRGSLHAPLAGGRLSLAAGSYVSEADEILLIAENEAEADSAVRQLIRIGIDRVEAWIRADDALADGSLTSSIPRIATRELSPVRQDGAVVLDVRTAQEFSAGHIEDALNVPYTRLAVRLDEIPRDGSVFVHCGSGARAALAAAFLAREGRHPVHVDGSFGEIASLQNSGS